MATPQSPTNKPPPQTTPPKTEPPPLPEDTVALSVFKQLDTNNDGKLSKEELEKGLAILHLPNNERVLNELLQKLDVNKDNEVSLEEFRIYAVEHSKQLRNLFESIDEDHNQYLDVQELHKILSRVHGHIDNVKLENLMKRIDVDKDGKISFDEWNRLLLLSPASELKELFDYWSDAQALDQGDEGFVVAPDRLKNAVGYFAAGAAAGIVSRTGTAPLERLKILYQVNQGKTPPLIEGFKSIYKEGGFKGLFRGNFANILKVAPESAIKFLAYETAKNYYLMMVKSQLGIVTDFLLELLLVLFLTFQCFP